MAHAGRTMTCGVLYALMLSGYNSTSAIKEQERWTQVDGQTARFPQEEYVCTVANKLWMLNINLKHGTWDEKHQNQMLLRQIWSDGWPRVTGSQSPLL